ncbi:hypothetical protein AVEN_31757-1 [Araneus ventricosus]|uniref:Uncharacterized protein n=1 Tax=Araneus ventricosus TaxID=182803 RepID=A0A4Y2L8E8_ARAVE|nr:hypothetical protein AVEN_31757-1 [Araneus ventricosus]
MRNLGLTPCVLLPATSGLFTVNCRGVYVPKKDEENRGFTKDMSLKFAPVDRYQGRPTRPSAFIFSSDGGKFCETSSEDDTNL